MKKVLKAITPPVLWSLGRSIVAQFRNDRGDVTTRIGRFDMLVPAESLLSRITDEQPFRNLAIGVIAKFVGDRNPDAILIDVGANVGGTAAMMASFCRNPLVLVEPSNLYLPYLQKNAAQFPNSVRIVKGIITDGTVGSPTLEHHRGTARVVDGPARPGDAILQLRLGDVRGDGVELVKIDADGWDFKIIEGSIEWIGKQQPILYYEAEVDTPGELEHASRVVESCRLVGYTSAILWDDAGCLVCATDRFEDVGDLFRYLLECRSQPAQQRLFAFNVGLFHGNDRAIYEQVAAYFRRGVPMQDGRVNFAA